MDDDGLVTAAEAHAQGLTQHDITRLIASGVWLRVLRGIYAVAALVVPSAALRRRAALRLAGEDGWLHGLSALAEWGVELEGSEVAHLAMVRTGALRGQRGLLVVHRATGPVAWVERAGVRLERLDPAVVSAFVALRGDRARQELICRVVRERRTTVARLLAAAGARGRFPGSRRFREILQLVDIGCRSPIEIDYLVLIERPFGLPPADRQHPLRRRRGARLGSAYGDAYYAELKLLVELDGREFHCDDDRVADLRRDLDLATVGVLTIRLTSRQVRFESGATAAALLATFAERRSLLGLAA